MIINHNISALNTHRQLNAANKAQSNNMEKLSSGLRINRAGDDAAGLAISEKMRAQIRGLDMASRNAQDGISLIQTAEGALNETHSILQRMRELAVQAANDTNTDDDRAELQKEIDQLISEIDRISKNTEFNTKKLLNGEAGSKVIFENNNAVLNASATEKAVAGVYNINVTTAAKQAEIKGNGFNDAAIAGDAGTEQTIIVNGHSIKFNVVTDAAQTAQNFIDAVNNMNIGITASGDAATGIVLTSHGYGSKEYVDIQASALTAAMGLTADAGTNNTQIGVDVVADITVNGSTVTGVTGEGTTLKGSGLASGLKVTLTSTAASSTGDKGNVTVVQNKLTMHIGANEGQNMHISIRSMSASDLGVNLIDLTDQAGADSAITTIDDAIKQVSAERAKLGAYQNRLEHTINNLGTSSENLTAAESRIRDVDMAKEIMEQTKNAILVQAAQAMLAQANQMPQGVLQLLQ